MSYGIEEILVHPSQVDRFKAHIDSAIETGDQAAKDRSGFTGDLQVEADEQIHLGNLMKRIEFREHATEDDPASEPKFTGPVEALWDVADSMARDFADEIQGLMRGVPSRRNIKIARIKLDDLEAWAESEESLAVSKEVGA